MTLFQYISLIPGIVLYGVISYKAYTEKELSKYDVAGWETGWVILTIVIAGLLPLIAFNL